MTTKEAAELKRRILACRTNELTKKIAIRRIFSIIDYMTEPEGPYMEIKKSVCPKCGTSIYDWSLRL